MKKILVIFYIIIGLGFGCDNNEFEPIEWDTYFVFLNQDKSDFFDSNLEYDPAGIIMRTNGINMTPHLDTLGTINRFHRRSALWDIQYIDYGNGDIDTLTMIWQPSEVNDPYYNKGTYFGSVDNIKFYLNEALVAEWDFIKDPGLKTDIVRSNGTAFKNNADFNPVLIVLPKDPDLEELD